MKKPLLPIFALVLGMLSFGVAFSTLAKALILTIAVILVAILAGCIYQAAATAADKNDYPPPGRLVSIHGHRMHIQVVGEGTPAVILEAGLSAMSSVWGWIHPEVAKFTKVISYDRAGLGWSEPDGVSFSALHAARRLHELLQLSGIRSPYVIVGHSMGGLLARMFADRYVNEVAGMVLVDASHPEQYTRNPLIRGYMNSGFRLLNKFPLLARLGYIRITGCLNMQAEGLPARQLAEAQVFLSSHGHLCATRRESLAWETICTEVRQAGNLGSKPLAVLSAGRDLLPGALGLQAELATLSTQSTHRIVKGATHVTLVTNREYAMSVVEAIRQVVEKARRNGAIRA